MLLLLLLLSGKEQGQERNHQLVKILLLINDLLPFTHWLRLWSSHISCMFACVFLLRVENKIARDTDNWWGGTQHSSTQTAVQWYYGNWQ